MRLWEIEEKAYAAIREGSRFLLVCYDVWDRQRGDKDGGYYYPRFQTAEEVRDALTRFQLGKDTASGSADVCEAVIDLSSVGGAFDAKLCEPPAKWPARAFPSRSGWRGLFRRGLH